MPESIVFADVVQGSISVVVSGGLVLFSSLKALKASSRESP